MVEMNTKLPHSQSLPVYVNPDSKSDINNIRLRNIKSNISTDSAAQPAHFILSTDDFPSNDFQSISRNKHNKTQIFLLIFTALSYLLYSLRAYIPENIQTNSQFWSNIKPIPITRIYTTELRLNLFIENFLLRLAEDFQTIWLIYILSHIPRRIHFGYVYRNPNIFNSSFCLLLLIALSLQIISQTPIPPEISCACLFINFLVLILSCRLIALKLVKYEEKIKRFDLIINRYFVLNCLFLYTTSIGYLTICASIECIAFHFNPNTVNITLITRIGLLIIFVLLLIYFLLDQFIYKNEFQSIWTPYLFLAIISMCPPLRSLLSDEIFMITNDFNFYLLWILFSMTILIIFFRISRKIIIKYCQMKMKSSKCSYNEPVSLETQTQ